MSSHDRMVKLGCADARRAIQDRQDQRPMIDAEEGLDAHLAWCDGCSEFRGDLLRMRRTLQEIPEISFPDRALERVWEQTIRRGSRGVWVRRWLVGWRPAVAAAVLALAAVSSELVYRGSNSATEVDRGAAEVFYVLEVTGSALRRAQVTAMDRVLTGAVASAARRFQIGVWQSNDP